MPDFVSFKASGVEDAIKKFEELGKAARDQKGHWVGTAVEHAEPNEFGTRYRAARPFMRPAIALAAQRWESGAIFTDLQENGRSASEKVFSFLLRGGSFTEEMAKYVRAEARRKITQKDIYETGELWASMATGRTFSEMLSKSVIQSGVLGQ